MTRAPSSMPRLRPVATRVPSSGLLKATSRMNPKYETIIAMVSEMAMRHRAADTASSVEWEGMKNPKPQNPNPKPQRYGWVLGFGIWDLGFLVTSRLRRDRRAGRRYRMSRRTVSYRPGR